MLISDWSQIQMHILHFEQKGLVTRTFRRLDSARQQAVINAILEEASEKGPALINIKEIASRAEVSIGSLYQYFENRDGVLDFAVALCVRYMVDLFEQFRPILSGMPLREGLRYYLMGGIEWGQTEIGLVRFFGRAAYQGEASMRADIVRPIATVMRETMQEILFHAVQRGEIRKEIDIDATVRLLNGLTITVGDAQLFPHLNDYFQITDPGMTMERILDALIELVFRGIS